MILSSVRLSILFTGKLVRSGEPSFVRMALLLLGNFTIHVICFFFWHRFGPMSTNYLFYV